MNDTNPNHKVTKVEFDHMPTDVATALLCTSPRLTNRERKNYMAARVTRYTSTRQPKPIEEKLNQKFQRATANQLRKWLKRANTHRADTQAAYLLAQKQHAKLSAMPVNPESPEQIQITAKLLFLDKAMSALAVKAGQIDTFRDNLEDEIERRFSFIAGLKKIAPTIAAKLKGTLV
jgi:hypothetical protein